MDLVDLASRIVSGCELYHAPQVTISALAPLLEALTPISPRLIPSARCDADEVRLIIGNAEQQSHHVSLSGTGDIVESAAESLGQGGWMITHSETKLHVASELSYGSAGPLSRQLIKWHLARLGIAHVVERQRFGPRDATIHLTLVDPQDVGRALKERAPLELIGDDLGALERARQLAQDAGYLSASIRLGAPEELCYFDGVVGALQRGSEPDELSALSAQILKELGVDDSRFTPHLIDGALDEMPVLRLPTAAYERGEVHPSDPGLIAHWRFTLHSLEDTAERLEALARRLNDHGAIGVTQTVLPDPLPDMSLSAKISWCYQVIPPSDVLKEEVKSQVLAFLTGDLEHTLTPLITTEEVVGDEDHCVIDVPKLFYQRAAYQKQVGQLSKGLNFRIKTEHRSAYKSLMDHFNSAHYKFSSTDFSSDSSSTPTIKFGKAPRVFIEFIQQYILEHTGHDCEIDKAWGDGDNDVWVYLPSPVVVVPVVEAASEQVSVRESWFEGATVDHTFIRLSEELLEIGDLQLPRRSGDQHPLAPSTKSFEHYCLDQRTADSLYHVAEGVLIGEPCLLEGETSVSKTSIILYLAMLMNQPVIRINLNGQTDTGELIGRFLPTSSTRDLPIPMNELSAQPQLLNPESLKILHEAEREERGLTPLETQRVISTESLPRRTWRWQDGAIIKALQRGWWVILDELNLAEPQILERLNSLLELNPSLVLSEYDGRIYGTKGHPIHPQFRIFGTMNPAEYDGRMTLSPAYRDRWTGYRFVERPHDTDYHAMLRYLVYGTQPEVTVFGQSYLAPEPKVAPFAHLASMPQIDMLLESLARFQSSLERAVDQVGGTQIGGRRRERYVFTRRGLLAIVRFLSNDLHARQNEADRTHDVRASICRYYLNRVTNREDQVVVLRLLDAVGLGIKSWRL